ncbi:hypothetical protein [Smaragdicoccus niigatensis]|uniref:hypothetical protein n=1 Tax=Smaragdicoccus niigatensis TaxID=359359 RepID=UPI00035FA888|nr:hypothetical protein [Smaragdicoccus niigatensis]
MNPEPTVTDAELSEAIVWGLSHGSPQGAPILSEQKMTAHYGAERAAVLLAAIRPLLHESGNMPIDWQKLEWQQAGDFVHSEMQRRHPSLSDDALQALRGHFMFQTR